MTSINEQLIEAISPLARKVNNVLIDKLEGQEINCLRLTRVKYGMSGDYTESLESQFINNVIVKFPTNEFELKYDYKEAEGRLDTKSIDLWDLLPITITVPFRIGNNTDEVINLKRGDIIVIPIFDEFYKSDLVVENNVMPILGTVSKLIGTFRAKQVFSKRYELAVYRGMPEPDILEAITNYVEGLKNII